MEKEDNVYGETTPAEQVAEAKEEKGSTVLGKFKDVDALARAYESLQAEFTRRSQKLRQLENEVENFKKEQAASGAEKLRKNAQARREAAKEFDAFVADMGAASKLDKKPIEDLSGEEKSTEKETEVSKENGPKRVEQVESEIQQGESFEGGKGEESFPFAKGKESAGISAEELFEKAVQDEAVRLRIVGEYLASLKGSGVPLTATGAGVFAAPPAKATSVDEAGNMALLYFRKPIEE